MAAVLIALYLIGITPLRLTALIRYPGDRPARVFLRAWGFRLPTGGGMRLSGGSAGLREALPVLRDLLRHSTLRRLEIRIRVGGDAARAALITGYLRALDAAVPRAQISCVPAFGEKGTLRAGCILDARLGILLAAALAGRLQRKARRNKEAAA